MPTVPTSSPASSSSGTTATTSEEFSAEPLVSLLTRYVDGQGGVDYTAWQTHPGDVAALDAFLAALAATSPESHPQRFAAPGATRAYYIHAYNAHVVKAVLELWPLASVRQVKGSLTSHLIPGKGFFYDRTFVLGGRSMNLYQLEHKVLRKQIHDPRIHFAINCASASCPALRPSQWNDAQLDAATRAFVNDRKNVLCDDDQRIVFLSAIFDWYGADFVDHHGWLSRKPRHTVLDYVIHYASAPLARRLEKARQEGYAIRYFDYDWRINARAG
jgi:hypothetical protein